MKYKTINTSLGALLIQLATTNYYWQMGETVGFSSILYKGFQADKQSLAIQTGMILSSLSVLVWFPAFEPVYPESPLVVKYGDGLIFALAGLLVGTGTKLGKGCTSGHMLCGLSRLRVRSLISTTVFVVSGFLTVYFTGNSFTSKTDDGLPPTYELYYLIGINVLLVYFILPFISKFYKGQPLKIFHGIYTGVLFGLGLHVAGMTDVRNTIGFLSILTPERFDPGLLLIFVFAIIPNMSLWKKIDRPLLTNKFNVATDNSVSVRLILGNVLFGVGWAVLGVCPGPGMVNVIRFPKLAVWIAGFAVGYGVAGHI